MSLRIAVQNGLAEIASGLINQGYEVVAMEENTDPVDVIVYSGVSNDLTGFDTIDYYGDGMTMGVNNPSGVMLVNAHSNSPEQVIASINNGFGWLEQ